MYKTSYERTLFHAILAYILIPVTQKSFALHSWRFILRAHTFCYSTKTNPLKKAVLQFVGFLCMYVHMHLYANSGIC